MLKRTLRSARGAGGQRRGGERYVRDCIGTTLTRATRIQRRSIERGVSRERLSLQINLSRTWMRRQREVFRYASNAPENVRAVAGEGIDERAEAKSLGIAKNR